MKFSEVFHLLQVSRFRRTFAPNFRAYYAQLLLIPKINTMMKVTTIAAVMLLTCHKTCKDKWSILLGNK